MQFINPGGDDGGMGVASASKEEDMEDPDDLVSGCGHVCG